MGNPFIAAALRNLSTLRTLAESANFDDQLMFIKMCDTLKLNVKHSAFHTDWDRQFVGTLIFNIAAALMETSKTPDMGYFDVEGVKACQSKIQTTMEFMKMNGAA